MDINSISDRGHWSFHDGEQTLGPFQTEVLSCASCSYHPAFKTDLKSQGKSIILRVLPTMAVSVAQLGGFHQDCSFLEDILNPTY